MFNFFSKMRGLRSSFSKKTTNDSLPTTVRANEEASMEDSDAGSASPTLHQVTNQVIDSQAEGARDQSLSSGAFAKITNNLLEVNQQIAKLIMLSEEDIRKDKDFSSLVNSFLEFCCMILDLCIAMERCFQRAKQSMLIILYAVKQFGRDQGEMELCERGEEKNKSTRILEDLKAFKAAGGDPFDEEFLRLCVLVNELELRDKHIRIFEELDKLKTSTGTTFDEEFSMLFTSLREQQCTLREKLGKQDKELRKKLRRINIWNRVSNIMFAVGFFSVPVLTAVVLVVSVPSAIEVLIGAFSATIGSIGKWCSYSWNKRQKAAVEQISRIESVNMSTYITMNNMGTLQRLISILDVEIESLMALAVLALREAENEEEERVKVGIDAIKKSLDFSLQIVEDAAVHASMCGNSISKGRGMVSRKLHSLPSGSASKRGNWLEIFM